MLTDKKIRSTYIRHNLTDSHNDNIVLGGLGDLTSWCRVASLGTEGIARDDHIPAGGGQCVICDRLLWMIVYLRLVDDWSGEAVGPCDLHP